ncbi:MAG: thiamine phosphate synthase [Chloroflexi bacterium]|nr:thiamine phosphate synthase [Chloroflexota bacterium]MYI03543.1 thiamine phosphate synthase [Chloroflexota bacterium]
MTEQKSIGRLHVITDEVLQTRFSHVELAASASAGGADTIQYREKRPVSTKEMIRVAALMSLACREHGATMLIDDRVDVAAAVGATAVHLGRDDLPPYVAREILGPEAIIGGTANSVEEAVKVAKQPVDYLGVGPVFGTTSKGYRAAPMLGLERFAEICSAVDLPVIGIGSITIERVADVLAAGAYGVAVLSAVVCQPDPEAACRAFADEIARVHA